MIDRSKITQIADQAALDQGLFVTDVSVSPDNDIQITVDASDRRLTINDCTTLSRTIENQLDRQILDFSLSVFSAGIGNPLSDHRQFPKIVGKIAEITFINGQKFEAKIIQTNININLTGNITIQYYVKETVQGKKRKELISKTETINMTDIKTVAEQLDIK